MRPALSPRAPRRPRSRSRGFFFSGRRLGRQKRLRGRLRQLVHELPDALAALYGPLELFEPGLGDVDGVVLPVRPPLEVVVDADAPVGQRLAVFADFALDGKRDVLHFGQYFGPFSCCSFHVL